MIYELLYTSVPKGLKPGAKGYCTVLTTEGIPSALLERLESYCGYRHLFDPGSPDNPDAYGHRVLNLAGNTWHILSRVADAGTDYSGRSNLIGHFMAISQDELKGISAGPTSLMMSPGLFRKELVGEPRRVTEAETSKRLGGVMDRPQKAVTWNMVTGDAGWAGKLVQTTEESSESVSLVYSLRTNTLKLLDEAVSILPKNKQWDITFNTFFTKSGEECRWRCYCANVPEAIPFKGSEFDLVDLKRRGLDPGDGVYVGAAREGKKMTGGVAKAGPPLSNNAKLNTGKSVEAGKKLANIRKGKQEVELVKQEEAEFISVVKKSIDVLPRKTGSVPPPVQREEHFDLLEEDLADGRKTVYRKQQSENPYKTALMISVPVLLCIILLLIFMGIFVNLSSQSKPKSDLVVLEKSNSKKDSDVPTDIKPILTKGMHNNNPPLNSTDDTFEAKVKEKEEEAKKLAEAKEKEKERKEEAKKLVEAKEKEKEKEEKAKTLAQKETQEKINKVVFVNAYKDDLDKNILIVPLDSHLKRVMTPENKELIQKEGITIVFPPDLNIKGLIDVNYIVDHNRDELAATKYKINLSVVDHNKAKIIFPEKMPKGKEIEEMCFAFSKLNLPNVSIIQYFEPLNLELILLESPGGLSKTDGLQFRILKDAVKNNLFNEVVPNQEFPLHPKFKYTFQNEDFMVVEKKEEVINIMNELEFRKEKKTKVLCLKQNSQSTNFRFVNIIEFRQYCCYLPLVIYRKDNPQLPGKYKSQPMEDNKDFEHIFDCKTYTEFASSKYYFQETKDLIMWYKGGGGNINRINDRFARELIISLGINCDPKNFLEEANKIYDEQIVQLQKIQGYTSKSCPNYNIVLEPYYRSTDKIIENISKSEKRKVKSIEDVSIKPDPKKEYEANQSLFKDVKLVLYKYLQESSKPK